MTPLAIGQYVLLPLASLDKMNDSTLCTPQGFGRSPDRDYWIIDLNVKPARNTLIWSFYAVPILHQRQPFTSSPSQSWHFRTLFYSFFLPWRFPPHLRCLFTTTTITNIRAADAEAKPMKTQGDTPKNQAVKRLHDKSRIMQLGTWW